LNKAPPSIEQSTKSQKISQVDPTHEESHPASADKKIDLLEQLLRRSSGAALGELIRATGWKAPSVRAALSKKKAQIWKDSLVSERRGSVLYYRLVDACPALVATGRSVDEVQTDV
jgi:hypothetical protein